MSLPPRIGRYEVVAPLAAGGMAEILLGRVVGPSGFERPVVIKRILPHLAREPRFEQMFLDEARIVAAIRHPNVVCVHELGREGDELFLVMEYLEGESLANVMRRTRSLDRPVDPTLVALIVAEACAGLHAAHELEANGQKQALVHRDVSPQNLVVTSAGQVKVIDFGIARVEERLSRTETGQIKGTFDYMAPEQVSGEPIDRRTDIFALGIVLYELLAGRHLFKRPTAAATVRAIAHEPIVPPSRVADGVPRSLEEIALRALEHAPDDRYATAAEMRGELLRAMRDLEGNAPAHDHAAALAALMHECFADRIAERQELMRRMRSGSPITHVPASAVEDRDLPTIADADMPMGDARARGSAANAPRRARRIAAGAAVGALTIALGVAASARLARRTAAAPRAPLASAPTAAPAIVAPPADAPPAATVALHIETRPAGAHAVVAGVDHGTTPLDVRVPSAAEPIAIELRHQGFAPLVERLVPDRDQRLVVALVPARAPADKPRAVAPAAPVARNAPAPPPDPAPQSAPPPTPRFHKFE